MMAKLDPQLDRFAGCVAAAFARTVAAELGQTHKLSVAGHTVHAAAVGTATGGVLLIGNTGAGKSTAALACLWEESLGFLPAKLNEAGFML